MEQAQAALAFSKISIETDGTAKGTKILLNGKEIADLGSLSMTFWNDGLSCPVSLGFTTRDKESKPGTITQTTYHTLHCPTESKGDAAKASLQIQPATPPNLLPRNERMAFWKQL